MSERDRGREEPMIIAGADELLRPATRRKFVRMLGVGGAIVMLPSVFTACDDDDDGGITGNQSPPPPPVQTSITFDLRTDVGIFRFAHTLEQLEALFYTAVVGASNFSTLFTDANERELLTDIRNHEVIHEAFFRTALGTAAVPSLATSLNSTTVNTILSSRANILNTARQFEDLGVAAYNGAGKYLKDARNLLVAGKIVSVEARHAAAIRDVAPPTGQNANIAFAGDDVVDTSGRDVKLEAGVVLTRVQGTNILSSTLNAALPTAITNAPDPVVQGPANATPDLFPANP